MPDKLDAIDIIHAWLQDNFPSQQWELAMSSTSDNGEKVIRWFWKDSPSFCKMTFVSHDNRQVYIRHVLSSKYYDYKINLYDKQWENGLREFLNNYGHTS